MYTKYSRSEIYIPYVYVVFYWSHIPFPSIWVRDERNSVSIDEATEQLITFSPSPLFPIQKTFFIFTFSFEIEMGGHKLANCYRDEISLVN